MNARTGAVRPVSGEEEGWRPKSGFYVAYAHDLLAEVYTRFTEGFDTADLLVRSPQAGVCDGCPASDGQRMWATSETEGVFSTASPPERSVLRLTL